MFAGRTFMGKPGSERPARSSEAPRRIQGGSFPRWDCVCAYALTIPHSARIRPILSQFGHILAEFGRHGAELEARAAPNLVELGRFRSEFDRPQLQFDHLWPGVDRIGPTLAHVFSKFGLESVTCCRIRANYCPSCPKSWGSQPKFAGRCMEIQQLLDPSTTESDCTEGNPHLSSIACAAHLPAVGSRMHVAGQVEPPTHPKQPCPARGLAAV